MTIARKSAFTRTLDYFKAVDLDEAKAALSSATAIVQGRGGAEPPKRRGRPRRRLNTTENAPERAQGATT